MAELAGGSQSAAAGYARRGVRASEQEGDRIYLRRNLHALGQAELRSGDTRAGVAALRRLRDLSPGRHRPADRALARRSGRWAGRPGRAGGGGRNAGRCPAGGDSADNVRTTYTANLSSEAANGAWRLQVRDIYRQDTGYLNSWTLTV